MPSDAARGLLLRTEWTPKHVAVTTTIFILMWFVVLQAAFTVSSMILIHSLDLGVLIGMIVVPVSVFLRSTFLSREAKARRWLDRA